MNDLALQIKKNNLGVCLDDTYLGILLYADDIILLAESESDLQNMLNLVSSWCHKWRLVINQSKTQIMHFRNKGMERSKQKFYFDSVLLEYVSSYKYLGFFLGEFMTFETGSGCLADSAGRALGSVINKIKVCNDMGYFTYTQLYNACVSPILNYAAGVWGFKESKVIDTIQNRAIRYFLGVHKFAPIPAIEGDMSWIPGCVQRKCEMIRLWNRLIKMAEDRIN